ncbi:MAG: hypothetical protein KJ970_13470 [Candidatus Eisenbacteria bacterium]|uniref:Uncharacterized protein n=1 Tax=Eiseniibacteriota bacterium TaxID=2212470 RepID=A0A948S150_UNCEI|nr:hypothetical protein [Candidatus Eisenbacteria bacterium]MBU1949534.1 hypothetical protein [Candidatus Eisenbacteria bacterium]MBU2691924.1 hypothetical protein [Candidatus Eisenbacteria bacterium]
MKGYGLRDVEGNLPVTERTNFTIRYSAKFFTAVVIDHIGNPHEHWPYDIFNCVKDASDPVFEDKKSTMDFKGNVDELCIMPELGLEEITIHRRPERQLLARRRGCRGRSNEPLDLSSVIQKAVQAKS